MNTYRIFQVGSSQLRSVTKIEPTTPFLCVNRSTVRYGFRAGANDIRYGVNILA